MSVQDYIHTISENLNDSATVKKIYGEPIIGVNRTVVPVAKIRFGFGAGSGKKRKGAEESDDKKNEGGGGGGGGGIVVIPVGVLEITEKHTEFIPIEDSRKYAGFLAAGFALGLLFLGLLKRK